MHTRLEEVLSYLDSERAALHDAVNLVPAHLRRGKVQIAISTGGTNPRVSAELRRKLEEVL